MTKGQESRRLEPEKVFDKEFGGITSPDNRD